MKFKDVEWVLTEPVIGSITGNATEVKGKRHGNNRGKHVRIAVFCGGGGNFKLLFDGQFVNVGEHLADFFSVLDEIAEQGHSDPYIEAKLAKKPVDAPADIELNTELIEDTP
jgi:hypothetical protein